MLPSLLVGTVAGSASHLSLAYLAAHDECATSIGKSVKQVV